VSAGLLIDTSRKAVPARGPDQANS
jgi:hypothetical protein